MFTWLVVMLAVVNLLWLGLVLPGITAKVCLGVVSLFVGVSLSAWMLSWLRSTTKSATQILLDLSFAVLAVAVKVYVWLISPIYLEEGKTLWIRARAQEHPVGRGDRSAGVFAVGNSPVVPIYGVPFSMQHAFQKTSSSFLVPSRLW